MQLSLRARVLTSMCAIAVVSTAFMLVLQHRSLSRDLETRAVQRFDDAGDAVEHLLDHHLEVMQDRYESISARPYVGAIVESGDLPSIADVASSIAEKQGYKAVGSKLHSQPWSL